MPLSMEKKKSGEEAKEEARKGSAKARYSYRH
jgi:hypothetical protein